MTARWRVGSMSMGLVLIALGVLMLLSFATGNIPAELIIRLWPVVMILIGLEILLHLFLAKKAENGGTVKIKYDILSILFIGFILLISTCYYAFTVYAGLYGTRADMLQALGIYTDSVYSERETSIDADKLVVFDGFQRIHVLPADNESFGFMYNVKMDTNDAEYANGVSDRLVSLDKQGSTAYAMYNYNAYSTRKVSWPTIECVIYLPEGKILDLTNFYGTLEYENSLVDSLLIR